MVLSIQNTPQDGSGGFGRDTYRAAASAALDAHPNWTKVDEGAFTYSSWIFREVWKSAGAGNRNNLDFHVILGEYSTTAFTIAASEGWDVTAHQPIYPVVRGKEPGGDLGWGGGSLMPLSDLYYENITISDVHQPYITVGASQITYGIYGDTTTYWAGMLELPPGHLDPIGLVMGRFNYTGSASTGGGGSSRDILGGRATTRGFGVGAHQHTYPSTLLRVGDPQDAYLDQRLALGGRILLEAHSAVAAKYRGMLPGLSFDQGGGVSLGDTITIDGETYVVVNAGDPLWALGTTSDG